MVWGWQLLARDQGRQVVVMSPIAKPLNQQLVAVQNGVVYPLC